MDPMLGPLFQRLTGIGPEGPSGMSPMRRFFATEPPRGAIGELHAGM